MKILFATDGSEIARAALDFLLRLPLAEDTELLLLTVIDREGLPEIAPATLSEERRRALEETEQAVRRGAERLLAAEAARARQAHFGGSTSVRAGHPATEICRAAEELGVALIALGSHGHHGFRRFILGSVSASVLQYAPCSVLLVPQPAARAAPPGRERLRILLAFDGSAAAEEAVELCAGLPLRDRAALTLLTVMPLVTLYRLDVRQRMSWYWHEQKVSARAALERAAVKLRWATSEVTTLLREDADVAGCILQTAVAEQSDLIILGHKGRNAIERVLLGSVTARIAANAPCPVLAVRV